MKDKVVIITGASSGIGKALSFELAARGAKVVLAARSKDNLYEIESKLKARGASVIAIPTDVSLEDDCRRLIAETVQHFGRIDVLINNAGISMRALFEQSGLDVIRRLMEVNFWGTIYCTKFALPYLLQTKGSVVGVSSIAGNKGLPGRTGYSASKFAIQGFLETLRIENMKNGLHVLIACPGFTSSNIRNKALAANGTTQGESPRDENSMMKAEDVAKKITNAIENRKQILVMTLQGKMIVFLNKIFPFILDRIVYNQLAKEPDSPFK
jgi:dehydrogenase/reductase SDR family member 7B